MILYSWTTLSGRTSDPVVGLGITRDRAKAQRDAEETLLSGSAFVAMIETVGAVSANRGMYPCYLRTGEAWVGRRNRSDGVAWRTFFARGIFSYLLELATRHLRLRELARVPENVEHQHY